MFYSHFSKFPWERTEVFQDVSSFWTVIFSDFMNVGFKKSSELRTEYI